MRIFVNVIAYNSVEVVRGALENFEAITTDSEHRRMVKTIFNPGYPLPSVAENETALKKLAHEFGFWFANIPNEGVLGNHNRIIHEFLHMEPGDYYVIYDPDVRIQEKGYISAAIEVLQSEPNIVFVCPSREFHHEKWCVDQHGRQLYTLPSGLRVAKYRSLIAWSCGVFKGEWLACRKRNFAAENPVYGYSEHCEYDRMNDAKKKWRQLADFHDYHLGADALYTEWKKLSSDKKTRQPFDAWLKERGVIK